jgi:hypothetical protein
MRTKVEIWLLGRAEAIVIHLVRRKWIGRPKAAKYLDLIEARLVESAGRNSL